MGEQKGRMDLRAQQEKGDGRKSFKRALAFKLYSGSREQTNINMFRTRQLVILKKKKKKRWRGIITHYPATSGVYVILVKIRF